MVQTVVAVYFVLTYVNLILIGRLTKSRDNVINNKM